jgi:glutamate/aspartate transport system permease protein
MTYQWDWSIFSTPAPDGSPSYFDMMVQACRTTLSLSAGAFAIAMAIGLPLGIARTSESKTIRALSRGYVEVFRNIPLLVQLFIWYFVVPEVLPPTLQVVAKTSLDAPFVLATIGLGLYTSARLCELVRAALEAIPLGQQSAAAALGMSSLQQLRYVLLPVAMRRIIPPLTSEAISVVKNSAVALTIGVFELTAAAREMQEYTFHIFEVFSFASLLYLAVNLVIVGLMVALDCALAIPAPSAALTPSPAERLVQ